MKTEVKITSKEISEITGKLHKNVLRSFKKIGQDWMEITGSNFELVNFLDSKNEARPMYILNKEECLYVTTKFNNKVRGKLILRWKELEDKERNNKPTLPTTYLEALKELVVKTEENERLELENKKKDIVIQVQAPKAEYHDKVLSSVGTYTTTQVAKDINLTANSLNKQLKGLNIHYKQSGTWMLYGDYLDKGYTDTTTITFTNSKGETVTKMNTKWTEKGRKFIHDLYSDGKLK